MQDATTGRFLPMPIEDRFWVKVRKLPNGCWEWQGAKSKAGYGYFAPTRKHQLLAHRYAYELLGRAIPAKMVVHHRCGHPFCVNPEHLKLLTSREHVLGGQTITAKNALKAHCPKGHLYDQSNLSPSGLRRGRRVCLTCHRDAENLRRSQCRVSTAPKHCLPPHSLIVCASCGIEAKQEAYGLCRKCYKHAYDKKQSMS